MAAVGGVGGFGKLEAAAAKHPCVHEITVSTCDSCCWVATVKQIMSAGGAVKIPQSGS